MLNCMRLLGRVHIVRKEMDQAEAAYLKAIEIDPKLVQAFMDLAQVYVVTKKFDKALVKLDESYQNGPEKHWRSNALRDFAPAGRGYSQGARGI